RWRRSGEAGRARGAAASRSGDRDLFVQVDVLNAVDEGGALGQRALEGLAADNEAHAPGPLVDHRGADGLGQVAVALGLAAGVDQADAAGVAVDDLPAGEVDRVLGRQLVVDQGGGPAEADGR